MPVETLGGPIPAPKTAFPANAHVARKVLVLAKSPMHFPRPELRWIPVRRAWISELADNDSPSRSPGSPPRFRCATECALLMPVEHQS
jgi:hypothetical protein